MYISLFFTTILIIALLYCIGMLIYIATGKRDKNEELNKKLKDLNTVQLCKCGISSRRYQLYNEHKVMICPHCEEKVYYSSQVTDDRIFPFAPKMTKKQFKKYIKDYENKEKIKRELNKLIAIDKEIETWQKLNTKKQQEMMEELENLKQEEL